MLMMNAVIMPCQRSVYPGVSVPCVCCMPTVPIHGQCKNKKRKVFRV